MLPNKQTPLSKLTNKRLSSSRGQSSVRGGTASPPLKKQNTLSQPHKVTSRTNDQMVQESNINVYVRCRSRNEREINENSGVVVSTLGHEGKEVILQTNQNSSINKTYTFDNVFGAESDQETVFQTVAKNSLDEMLAGYNCTIFAYGQTGTGKTYTMSGDITATANGVLGVHAGIVPRTLVELFKNLERSHPEYTVRISFIELYNEELKDLLVPEDCEKKVRIYDDHDKKSIVVQGMEERFIHSAAEGLKLLGDGSYKRQVAATQCNDLSSRSHTVFTITVHMKKIDPLSGEEYLKVGKLNLVDLAGSENINRSGAENKRAREAGMINQSLLTLGRVINCLVDKSSHIPYRESKLTRLLQDSLGGKTKTCIIATISPAKVSLEETLSTLEYANRAKSIKNKPAVNQSMSKQMLIGEYIQEIESLRSDLAATRKQTGGIYMTTENHQKLVDESESRKILVDEQRMRIKLLEDQNQKFKETYEQQLEECKLTKSQLSRAQAELKESRDQFSEMEIRAIEFENKYQDEVIINEELERTEFQSQAIYKSLVRVVGEIIKSKEQLAGVIHQNLQAFNESNECLNAKKAEVSDLVDHNLTKSLSLLQVQHDDLIDQLSNRFTEVLDINKTTVTNIMSDVFTRKEKAVKSLATVASEFSGIMNALITKISNVESAVQDSFHSVGQNFKESFELIQGQFAVQIEELAKLTAAAEKHHRRTNDMWREQILANEITHKKEMEEQQKDQNDLLHKIIDLVKSKDTQRQKRMSESFKMAQDSLSTIRSNDAKFVDSHYSLVKNLLKSETLFASAISDQRDNLKSNLVASHEASKKEILALESNARYQLSDGDTNVPTLVFILGQMQSTTADSFDHMIDNFGSLNINLNEMKPTVIDKYTEDQQKLLSSYRESATTGNQAIRDSLNSLVFPKPNTTVPPFRNYEYPKSLPLSKDREQLLQFKRNRIRVSKDDGPSNESILINEAENMTPLPVPIPDRPMVENTPTSLMKVKNLKNLGRSRPTTGSSNNSSKSKALQELNI